MRRGAGRRLLAARGREFDEQQLHADAHELDHFGERGFVLFVLFVRIDAHMRDLGEVANDLAGLGGHLAQDRRRDPEPRPYRNPWHHRHRASARSESGASSSGSSGSKSASLPASVRTMSRRRSAAPSFAAPRLRANRPAGFRAAIRSGRSRANCTAHRPGCRAPRPVRAARALPGARARTRRKWRPTWGNYALARREPHDGKRRRSGGVH